MIAEPGYYLVGNFGGTELWFVDGNSADRLMTEVEDGIFEVVYNFTAGDTYKIISFDGYAITWPDGNDLVVNESGELAMRYEAATGKSFIYHGCDHVKHDADGFCVNCGEEVGHSYEGNVCPGCGNEINTLTIFFRNDWNWSDVKIYYWGSVVPGAEWPGVAMDEYEGNIYSFNIPEDVEGFLISGKDNGVDKQTADIKEGIAEGNCYYMNWTEELGEHVCVITIDEALNPPCDHAEHDQNGICLSCGETVEHNYSDGFCSCGAADPDYIPPCEHANHDVDGNCVDCGEPVEHNYVDDICSCGKELEYVTVYFQNNWLWSDISIYYWGSSIGDVEWPGVAMELVGNDGTYDYYSYIIPVDVDAIIVNGQKSDSTDRDQTPNIVDFYDGICFYMDWADGNIAGSFDFSEVIFPACMHETHDIDGNCVDCGEPVEHDYVDGFCSCGAEDPNYVPPCDHVQHDLDGNCTNCGEYIGHTYDENYTCFCGAVMETITVYFRNNWMWNEVSIYHWTGIDGNVAWPGTAMDLYANDGQCDIYTATIPADISGIIINGKKDDGSNTLDQTPDITGENIFDGVCYQMAWDNGNKVEIVDLDKLLCEHTEHDIDGNCLSCGTAVEHVYEAVVTEPNCENPGYTTYTCACGSEYTDNETDPVHGVIIHVEAVAATCYENGNIEHWYCETCEQVWQDEALTQLTNHKNVIVAATGHTYVDGECHCGAKEENPSTGDFARVVIAVLAVSAAAIVAIVPSKKRVF